METQKNLYKYYINKISMKLNLHEVPKRQEGDTLQDFYLWTFIF